MSHNQAFGLDKYLVLMVLDPETFRYLNPMKPQRPKKLSAAAKRALEEAEARRVAIDAQVDSMPKELHGRKKGLEPSRYGDWEKDGIASDF